MAAWMVDWPQVDRHRPLKILVGNDSITGSCLA
ncbi:hypothetical protein K227x_08150 [Rubripirellula lacrimiformis]|uniref:Uncharacterized protein n=1 Tax=Rubripirellula lacrimiformis TaxID=1930273 RepID=A0A517N601_9BACT|nr:hypothetical protein K227x_08150 [Rubripirellula lacrimiformis]